MELYPVITGILGGAISSSVAVLLPSLGEGISQRAGVINIGAEGYMLVGALGGYLTYVESGSIALGFLVAIVAGIILSLVHAFLSITLKCDQIIGGLGIWLFGLGLTSYVFRLAIKGTAPLVERLEMLPIPLLKDIPIIGEAFFQQNILVYISFFLVLVFAIIVGKTPWGLLTKGAGDSPLATDMAGHSVSLIRYISIMVCGALAGLGGAYLSIGVLSKFGENMTAGRGFIALVIVIFGRWDPKIILGGAFLFSLVDALQMYLQATGSIIPFPLLIMMPYLLTLILLVATSRGMSKMPRKLCLPYIRGEE